MKAAFTINSNNQNGDYRQQGLSWLSRIIFEAVFWEILFERNGPFHELYYYGSEIGRKAFERLVNQVVREERRGVFRQELVYPTATHNFDSRLRDFELLLQNLYRALFGWIRGEEYESFEWETGRSSVEDGDYPIDNGISITEDTVRIWVYNSELRIIRRIDDEFQFFAQGQRYSFSENFTGSIPLKIWEEAKRCSTIQDLSVESRGQEWDNSSIERIFSPTIESMVTRFLFGFYEEGVLSEFFGVGDGAVSVQRAARKLIEALQGK